MSMIKADETHAGDPTPEQLRQEELARWDGEGGAGPLGRQEALVSGQDALVSGNGELAQPDLAHTGQNSAASAPADLRNAEVVQLRIRVIALENLVVALLAGASAQRLDLVREMAAYISPRSGVTRHPLTLRASVQMNHLVGQAGHFRTIAST